MYKLLQPLNTNKIKLKNRLIMPPMATSKPDNYGKVTKELLDYYDEKSKDGYFSAVIIEHSFISPDGRAKIGQLSIADDDVIEGISHLANTIHSNGSKAIMQINHAGSGAKKEAVKNEVVAPSAIVHPDNDVVPRELTMREIEEIIKQFASAASRVKKAGFDGVEIHSCHGYLLNQFLSPLSNKRTDEYGGDIYKRIKMHIEVVKAVRAAVGDEFPILLRLAGSDYMDGGITIEDSIVAAAELEKAGVDFFDISGGFCKYTLPIFTSQGFFSNLSEQIKKSVSIPVILTGGVTDIIAAENILNEGKADLIGVGRAVLKDSLWAKKAIESLK
ncbi:MAG: NADH:flavin oxidoreductase [Eubacteriaceae bacterium]|nr:NADH:flavin oxidoreductase [Eubacteriaceae bacterium]